MIQSSYVIDYNYVFEVVIMLIIINIIIHSNFILVPYSGLVMKQTKGIDQ